MCDGGKYSKAEGRLSGESGETPVRVTCGNLPAMASAATFDTRLTDVESDVHQLGHTQRRTADAIAHLTDGVGDLSQQLRSVGHEVGELRTELGQLRNEMEEGFAGVQRDLAEHGEMLRLILERLPER